MRALSDSLIRLVYALVSGGRASKALGRLAEARLPPRILRRLIATYCRVFLVDLSDTEIPRGGFKTFNEFFTRRLIPGARSVDQDPEVVVAPSDGKVMAVGFVENGLVLQAKGRFYTLAKLLGDEALCQSFEGGPYVSVYLSPRDYHRVHVPCDAKIEEVRYLPGRLFTVTPKAAAAVQDLLPRNERVLFLMRTRFGLIVVCMIGATGVGRITTPFSEISSNRFSHDEPYCARPEITVRKGDELGTFNMGSSVVMLLPRGPWAVLSPSAGSQVRMGQGLFRFKGC